MKIEIRADGAHISGYVNVTEKKSRPVVTPHGKVVEEIEPEKNRVSVMVSMFGRETPVELELDQVEVQD